MDIVTETFFRPDEIARERTTIPAHLFNRCRLLLARCELDHVFVPVRSMQYQAVIDRDEIIFVDNHTYAVRGGTGGRLIVLSWMFGHIGPRSSLDRPVPIELVHYQHDARSIHQRLMSEFPAALENVERRAASPEASVRRTVVEFPRPRERNV